MDWITALPTHSSQRNVASAINPTAASTASNGIARRFHDEVLLEPDGDFTDRALATAGETGADPDWLCDGAGLIWSCALKKVPSNLRPSQQTIGTRLRPGRYLDMTTILPQTVFSGQRQRSLIRHTSHRGLRAKQV